MSISIIISILAGFIITWLTIPQIIHVARVKKLFDEPNSRKLNHKAVPTMGGIGIFIGFTLSSTLALGDQSFLEIRFIYAASIIMLFVGLKDDILSITAIKKFLVQMAAVLMLVTLGNFRISNLYGLFSIYELPMWAGLSLSFLIFLFLINAFNLIDGIDGLAGGLASLISASLGTWFLISGHAAYAILSFALLGSLLAFLRFNVWKGNSKIFMGDTGSLLIGVVVSCLIIKFINLNQEVPANMYLAQAPLIALSLLIVPVTDTLRVFVVRILKGDSPFSPDMNHIHHILIRSGLSHIQASIFLILYTICFFLLALNLRAYFPLTVNFLLILGLSFSMVGILKSRDPQFRRIYKNKLSILKNSVNGDDKIIPGTRISIDSTVNEPAAVNSKKFIKVNE